MTGDALNQDCFSQSIDVSFLFSVGICILKQVSAAVLADDTPIAAWQKLISRFGYPMLPSVFVSDYSEYMIHWRGTNVTQTFIAMRIRTTMMSEIGFRRASHVSKPSRTAENLRGLHGMYGRWAIVCRLGNGFLRRLRSHSV